MDLYILPNVKQIASWKQPHNTGRSAWCFVTTLRGEIGRVGGRKEEIEQEWTRMQECRRKTSESRRRVQRITIVSWTCCWMCISIQGWPASQKGADIGRASSLVCLACGIPQASLGPRRNSQHFLTLSLALLGCQLKLCTSDWDLKPRARTRTRPKPTVFQLRSHTWSQDLMKLRFLMSHCGKNSVRDKAIGKKWIYLERNTLHRMWAISEGEKGTKVWGCQFL